MDEDIKEVMNYLPDNVKLAMKADVENPPKNFADFFIIESGNLRASSFDGLNDDEISKNIEDDRNTIK